MDKTVFMYLQYQPLDKYIRYLINSGKTLSTMFSCVAMATMVCRQETLLHNEGFWPSVSM